MANSDADTKGRSEKGERVGEARDVVEEPKEAEDPKRKRNDPASSDEVSPSENPSIPSDDGDDKKNKKNKNKSKKLLSDGDDIPLEESSRHVVRTSSDVKSAIQRAKKNARVTPRSKPTRKTESEEFEARDANEEKEEKSSVKRGQSTKNAKDKVIQVTPTALDAMLLGHLNHGIPLHQAQAIRDYIRLSKSIDCIRLYHSIKNFHCTFVSQLLQSYKLNDELKAQLAKEDLPGEMRRLVVDFLRAQQQARSVLEISVKEGTRMLMEGLQRYDEQ